MQIEVISVSKDKCGLISAMFRVRDGETIGSDEKHTVSALEIAERYSGDAEKWIREAVAPMMIERHKARTAVHTSLSLLRGKKIDI